MGDCRPRGARAGPALAPQHRWASRSCAAAPARSSCGLWASSSLSAVSGWLPCRRRALPLPRFSSRVSRRRPQAALPFLPWARLSQHPSPPALDSHSLAACTSHACRALACLPLHLRASRAGLPPSARGLRWGAPGQRPGGTSALMVPSSGGGWLLHTLVLSHPGICLLQASGAPALPAHARPPCTHSVGSMRASKRLRTEQLPHTQGQVQSGPQVPCASPSREPWQAFPIPLRGTGQMAWSPDPLGVPRQTGPSLIGSGGGSLLRTREVGCVVWARQANPGRQSGKLRGDSPCWQRWGTCRP